MPRWTSFARTIHTASRSEHAAGTGTGEFARRPGEFIPRRFKHPRDTDQYHFAAILQKEAMEEWYPDVVIKTVKTGDQ